MKRWNFNRKRLLHALRAAALALFLLAAAQKANAQVSPPFQVSGSTVTTSAGTYGNGAGLYEPGASYTSVTIGSGTTINATVPYGPDGTIVSTSTASFSNAGNLSVTASGNYQATVLLDQGALSLNATNSGSISANEPGGNVHETVLLNSTSGNLGFTNSGSLYGVNSNLSNVLSVQSVSGNISITNSHGGTITTGSAGYAVGASTSAAGTIILTNAGTLTTNGINSTAVRLQTDAGSLTATNYGIISATGEGMRAESNSTGAVTVTNSGNITSVSEGLDLDSFTGLITATNTGTITSTTATAIETDSNGVASVTNSGTLNGSYTGIYEEAGASATILNSGTVNGGSNSGLYAGGDTISVTNTRTGTVTNSGSGIYAEEYGAGTITVLNQGSITASTYGIQVRPVSGSLVTVTNSGLINVSGTGIVLYGVGSVIDSGSITGGVAAISVPSGSSVTLRGNAAITGTIIGGPTPSSTSTLAFNLGIPAADLAAARAQLDSEVAAYAAQNGGSYMFVIDGRTFNISNFLYNGGITDDLIAAINRLYARTPGYHSLGSTLDNLNTNTAQGAALSSALGRVPDAGLPSALAELSPKDLQVFRNVANDNNTFNRSQIDNHLANLRDGLTGFDSSALTVQDSSMDPTLSQVNSHLLAYNPASTPGLLSDSETMFDGMDPKDMKSCRVNTMPTDRWSSFIAGNVILADLSSNTLPDANYTTGTVTAGLDYRLDDHFTIGALVAFAHTDVDLDNRGSSATVDSYTPGIYASYVDGGWYGNAMGSYVRNAYTDDRIVDIPGIAGDNHGGTSGNQGTFNTTGGYEFQKGGFKFGPVVSLEYVHLAIQSLEEQGPASLNINSQDEDSLRSLIGFEGRFEANTNSPFGRLTLTPHFSASWQHEYMDGSRGITSQFSSAGGGSFSVETDSPERDAAFIDVGLDAKVSKNVTVFIDYETQVGQDNFFAQSAQGGVKIGF